MLWEKLDKVYTSKNGWSSKDKKDKEENKENKRD